MTQPQSAYACFVSGYEHKLTYFLRAILGIEEYLDPLDETIKTTFIPAITGGHQVNEEERKLLSLPPRLGMRIKVFTELALVEFDNSKKFTKKLQNDITNNDTGEDEKKTSNRSNASVDNGTITKIFDWKINQRSWLSSEQGAILGRYPDQIRLDSTTSTAHVESDTRSPTLL